jgi:hypothetical protein
MSPEHRHGNRHSANAPGSAHASRPHAVNATPSGHAGHNIGIPLAGGVLFAQGVLLSLRRRVLWGTQSGTGRLDARQDTRAT